MKAYQMTGFQQLPEFREVDVSEPGAGEVLIKVELMEVLALARDGKIRSRIRRFPLSQAADAYAQLREGKIDGRAVITPQVP